MVVGFDGMENQLQMVRSIAFRVAVLSLLAPGERKTVALERTVRRHKGWN